MIAGPRGGRKAAARQRAPGTPSPSVRLAAKRSRSLPAMARSTLFRAMPGAEFGGVRRAGSGSLRCPSQPTLRGHTPCVPGRGWRGAVPPLTPTTATARHERWTRRLGEGPRERRGACRVARQGALGGLDAVRSGAPFGRPGPHLDRGSRRRGARAHPRVGAHWQQPQPDRSLGQYPRGRASDPGAGLSRQPPIPMHIKFLARGGGSGRVPGFGLRTRAAAVAADRLIGAQNETYPPIWKRTRAVPPDSSPT